MIDERTEELASLYAFDLLEGAERDAFQTRLASEQDLQVLVQQLRESAASMGFTAPSVAPSPELKQRIMQQIANRPVRVATPQVDNVVPFPITRWLPWAAAAGFALLSGILAQNLVLRRSESLELRTRASLAEISRQDAENRLKAERLILNQQIADTSRQLSETKGQVADLATQISTANQRIATLNRELKSQGDLAEFKIATLSSMLGNSPQALAVAVWNPAKQEGVFTVEKLPAAASNQDYELWIIDPQQKTPVSAGIIAVNANGMGRATFKTESPIVSVGKFALTLESKGGAPAHGGPKGPAVLVSPSLQ